MNRARIRKSAILAMVGGVALMTLSACINITYTLNVNPDATLSGTVQLAVSKQAASVLGISSAEDLNSQLKSGQLSDQTSSKALDDCTGSQDADNLVLSCTIANAQASDIEQGWSMTVDGDMATFHAVSQAPSTDSSPIDIPGLSQNSFTFTLTFPGEISSVTGDGAVQSGPNTVTVKSTLDKPVDFTVVGSLGSSTPMIWIYLLLAVVAVLAVGFLAYVLRTGSRKKDEGTPALDAAAVPAAIEAPAPDAPEGQS